MSLVILSWDWNIYFEGSSKKKLLTDSNSDKIILLIVTSTNINQTIYTKLVAYSDYVLGLNLFQIVPKDCTGCRSHRAIVVPFRFTYKPFVYRIDLFINMTIKEDWRRSSTFMLNLFKYSNFIALNMLEWVNLYWYWCKVWVVVWTFLRNHFWQILYI